MENELQPFAAAQNSAAGFCQCLIEIGASKLNITFGMPDGTTYVVSARPVDDADAYIEALDRLEYDGKDYL